jgi:hypothetical protein
MRFVVDKLALGQVVSEYFGISCKFSFQQCSTIIIIYHLGLVKQTNSARSTKWTKSHPIKNNKK